MIDFGEEVKRRQSGTQYKVRFPDELHAWLKETGDKHDRSMNYLIVKAVKLLKEKMEI